MPVIAVCWNHKEIQVLRRSPFIISFFAAGLLITSGLLCQSGTLLMAQEVTDAEPAPEVTDKDVADPEVPDQAVDADDEDRVASEHLLPASTKAWFSVPDPDALEQHFDATQFGKLTKDEALKPFLNSMHEQIQSWINEKNVRFGLKLEDLDTVHSGEICLAGVMRNAAPDQPKLGRGAHGMVLMVDVHNTEEQARELLARVDKELVVQGAERVEIEGESEVQLIKWKLPQVPHLPPRDRFAFHAIANGWLIASDNEVIFRNIIRRAVDPQNVIPEETLASIPSFQIISEQAALDGYEHHVDWFIDPFGYVKLAQAIADEDQQFRQRRDDWAGTLTELGFDVFQGVGGTISFATGRHELVHRTFVYMPHTSDKERSRVFGLFNFANSAGKSLAPPKFVPHESAGYFSGTWDMSAAVQNVGDVVDAFLKEPGLFDHMLTSFKTDRNIDLKEIVRSLDDQLFIVSETKSPITEESERVLIAIPVSENHEIVFDAFRKHLLGKATVMDLAGIEVLEIDTTAEMEDFNDLDDPFGDPFSDEGIGQEEMEEVPEEFTLFEKRYVAMKDGWLLVTNRKEYMEKILTLAQDKTLDQCDDYRAVEIALAEFCNTERVAFRQFGRIDQSLKTNYEMMRQGKMGSSSTVLARVLNQVLKTDNSGAVRQQKLDATKLPEDYEKHVAPYFGPMGWVLETTEEGWLISGVMLKKNNTKQVVRAPEDAEVKQR